MRIVCDTSVATSGVLWSGIPAKILNLAEERLIEFCGTMKTIAEFKRVLGYEEFRKRIHQLNLDVSSIVDFYSDLITFFESEKLADIVVKENPDDDIFISAALASASKLIVSGDNHLLSLGRFQDIWVLSPRELYKRLK